MNTKYRKNYMNLAHLRVNPESFMKHKVIVRDVVVFYSDDGERASQHYDRHREISKRRRGFDVTWCIDNVPHKEITFSSYGDVIQDL